MKKIKLVSNYYRHISVRDGTGNKAALFSVLSLSSYMIFFTRLRSRVVLACLSLLIEKNMPYSRTHVFPKLP